MLYLVITSLLLHTLALGWALVLLRRLRDWRLSFIIAALALVVLLDFASLIAPLRPIVGPLTPESALTRLGVLTVSVLVLISMFAVGMLAADRERFARLVGRNRERYRRLVDSIGVITWEADAKTWAFTFVSERAEAILGFPVERWMEPDFWVGQIHPDDRERIVRLCREASERGEDYEFEYRMVRKDGSLVWLHDVVSVTMRDGKAWRIHGAMIDITARKEAEQEVRESDERYRYLFAKHPQPMWVYDRETLRFLEVNDAAIRHYGYLREEFLGMTIREIRPAEDIALLEAVLAEPAREDPPPHYRHMKKDGTLLEVKVTSHPVNYKGRAARLVVIDDVTERNRAERERQQLEAEREQLLRRLGVQFEKMPVGCILTDETRRITDWNPWAERIFGWKREEAIGRPLIETLVPPELREEIWGLFSRMEAGEDTIYNTNDNITRDGRRITCEWQNTLMYDEQGRLTGVLCTVQDVTERIAAEEALRSSEARLQRIFNGNIMGIVSWMRDGRIVEANDVHLNMTGYTREDVAAGRLRWPDLTPPEHAWLIERALAEIEATGVCVPFESELIRKDGVRLAVLLGGARLEEEPERGVAFAVDISALKQARQLFRQSEERYRRLAEHGAMGIWEVTRDGRTVYANPAMCEMLEIESLEELRGMDFRQFFTPAALELVEQERVKRLRGEESSYEVELIGAKGSRRSVMISGAPVIAPGETLETFLGTFTDITGLKRAEEALRQSQKMDAVGQLASGVAHDFNNLITAIFGYTSLARRTLSPDHPATAALDRVDAAARQASGVTRGLLTFSREDPPEKKPIRLGTTVSEAVALVRRMLPSNISLRIELDEEDRDWLLGDPIQIQQVVMNLAINARDAMPEGGELRICVKSPEPEHGLNGEWQNYLALEVQDSGQGMPAAVLARIFEPFFTTKPPGRGTGLGLPIIHGIVKEHGGQVKVSSSPSQGSRFTVLLPRCEAPSEDETAPECQSAALPRDRTIMLVESRTYVREIIASMLQTLGHQVVQCRDGGELALARGGAGARAALLIVDGDEAEPRGAESEAAAAVRGIGGASVNGEHAAEVGFEARQRPGRPGGIDPGVRGSLPAIVMVSSVEGLKDDPKTRTYYLQKPFQMDELAAAVALALAEPKEPKT